MTTQATPPGADLHLGGDAYAHPSLEPRLVPITDVTPYPGNPRRGDQEAITSSIRDLGLYAGVVVQRSTGHIVVGNHRRHALLELGADLIPVDYLDVTDTRAAAIVARDNHTSDLGGYDDADLLALLTSDEDVLPLSGYDADDLALLRRAEPDPEDPERYSRRANALIYEPTMDEPPPPAALVDRGKTNDLIRQIGDVPDLPVEVRDFLIAGAQRHLVFDYAKVAEFYAHAPAEVQALMEASALVIPDLEDAIAHGFVRLSSRLSRILDQDLTEREAQDAAGVGYGA